MRKERLLKERAEQMKRRNKILIQRQATRKANEASSYKSTSNTKAEPKVIQNKNYLSIVVIIKNRTKVVVKQNGRRHTLRLFENNLNSLLNLIQSTDVWQLVVVDFNSTDVNMGDFLKEKFTKAAKSNFTYTLHTLDDDKFCKGKGLNTASDLAKYENLLFLDADMLIKKKNLFNYGYKFLKQGKAYFPICMSYTSPQHVKATLRRSGKGNVFITKTLMNTSKWGEYEKWGAEDTNFYNIFKKQKLTVRNNVDKTFFHQWHPTNITWKNRFYI